MNLYYIYKLYINNKLNKKILLTAIKYPLDHLIYIALPHILFSIEKNKNINTKLLNISKEILSNFTKIDKNSNTLKDWEKTKNICFELWEIICH
jgi:hypothetical protein